MHKLKDSLWLSRRPHYADCYCQVVILGFYIKSFHNLFIIMDGADKKHAGSIAVELFSGLNSCSLVDHRVIYPCLHYSLLALDHICLEELNLEVEGS